MNHIGDNNNPENHAADAAAAESQIENAIATIEARHGPIPAEGWAYIKDLLNKVQDNTPSPVKAGMSAVFVEAPQELYKNKRWAMGTCVLLVEAMVGVFATAVYSTMIDHKEETFKSVWSNEKFYHSPLADFCTGLAVTGYTMAGTLGAAYVGALGTVIGKRALAAWQNRSSENAVVQAEEGHVLHAANEEASGIHMGTVRSTLNSTDELRNRLQGSSTVNIQAPSQGMCIVQISHDEGSQGFNITREHLQPLFGRGNIQDGTYRLASNGLLTGNTPNVSPPGSSQGRPSGRGRT